jgi:hypothetical protein
MRAHNGVMFRYCRVKIGLKPGVHVRVDFILDSEVRGIGQQELGIHGTDIPRC